MKRALSLELGGFKEIDVFNSFYSEDLILFGMQNNIPEAIRLGEKMLEENEVALSTELALAVKKYRLNNSERYMEAMKRTGPISTSSVYKNLSNRANPHQYGQSIVNTEDPYWRALLERNYRT